MLIAILTHTPLWVWGLFTALVGLGLWQRRSRQVAPAQLLALPLVMLALGLWSLAPSFAAQPMVALVWLKALVVFALIGRRLPAPSGTHWQARTQRLHLPGSWLPLLLIVTIFTLRYAANVGSVLHPEWRGQWQVQVPLALVFGALSGVFLGRALGLLRLTRPLQATIAAHASRALV